MEFTNLVVVLAVAASVPLLLGLVPRFPVPVVVIEIVAGMLVGPSVLGWVEVDRTVSVLSLIGLAFLLFLSGVEVDVARLRGRRAREAGLGMLVSLAIAVVAGFVLVGIGVAETPLLIAVTLVGTSLGIVFPLLKDTGRIDAPVGQLAIAGASIADIVAVVLLSLLFSAESTGTGARALLLALFGGFVVLLGFAVGRAEHSFRIDRLLDRLDETTAQLRVRVAVLLLVGLSAVAEGFGLEAILGAFVAGAVLRLIDEKGMHRHPETMHKLDGIGFGFLIPVFFVASGVRFDLDALFAGADVLLRVPLFLAAMMLIRGLPALVYHRTLGRREVAVAGLLQATSLPFIVAATQIGQSLDLLSAGTAAALVAAGLVSVLVFPAVALRLMRSLPTHVEEPETAPPADLPTQTTGGVTTVPGEAGAGTPGR